MEKKICKGINRKGVKCSSFTHGDSDFCIHHDPRNIDIRSAQKTKKKKFSTEHPWWFAFIVGIIVSFIFLLINDSPSSEELLLKKDLKFIYTKDGFLIPTKKTIETEIENEFKRVKDKALNIYSLALKEVDEENHRKAIEYFNDAIKLVNISYFHSMKGYSCVAISEYENALHSFNEAKKIFTKKNKKSEIASMIGNIGATYQLMGNIDESLLFQKEALELYLEIGDSTGASANLGNLGLIYWRKGNYKEALRYHKRALKIDLVLNDKNALARDYTNIGLLMSSIGKYHNAHIYYKKSLDMHRFLNDKMGETILLGNIGVNFSDLKLLDKSIKYHTDALNKSKEIDFKQGIAVAYGNLGVVSQKKGNLDKALEYHLKALDIDNQIKYKQGQAEQLCNIAMIYQTSNNLSKALKYYNEGLELFIEMGTSVEVQKVNENIASVQQRISAEKKKTKL